MYGHDSVSFPDAIPAHRWILCLAEKVSLLTRTSVCDRSRRLCNKSKHNKTIEPQNAQALHEVVDV